NNEHNCLHNLLIDVSEPCFILLDGGKERIRDFIQCEGQVFDRKIFKIRSAGKIADFGDREKPADDQDVQIIEGGVQKAGQTELITEVKMVPQTSLVEHKDGSPS